MVDIKAKEAEIVPKKVSLLDRLKRRINYDTKKMDVLMGKYDLDTKVILNQNALIKAVTYSAVTIKVHGHKEIMGWLAGRYNEKGEVEVVDAYVGNCESSAAYTELNPLETIRMSKIAKERGLKLVGQWHSHPSFSTEPSGIDDDFMRTIEKFGVKTPVQLIVNMDGFSLTMMEKGHRKKVEFILPPKVDNSLDIHLGFINGEYEPPHIGYGIGYFGPVMYPTFNGGNDINTPIMEDVMSFFAWIGNRFYSGLSIVLPFAKRWVSD